MVKAVATSPVTAEAAAAPPKTPAAVESPATMAGAARPPVTASSVPATRVVPPTYAESWFGDGGKE